jgi:hypothetical protein
MKLILRMVLLLAAVGAPGVWAEQNKGAEQMVLDGGSSGPVPFAHHRHQAVVVQCAGCHDLFPQAKNSIATLIAQGQLANKQVMNKLCIQCHKAKKKAGEAGGPTSCTQCHRK